MPRTDRRRSTVIPRLVCAVARIAVLVLTVAAWPSIAAAPASAGVAFTADPVATGLDYPAAFTFAPNGKIFYLEKDTGEIRIYDPVGDTDQLFATVPGVNAEQERGMLGIALHPAYPQRPFVFVYATRTTNGSLKNQILRYSNHDGTGRDRRTIFSTAASADPYHNGGRIEFGPDHELYAIVGEGHHAANSQDLSNPRGKILRMTPLGKRPNDNPIRGSKIFAYGIRNSFGFDFDPANGRLWLTDNGPTCNDEVNRIVGGGNYGWGPNATCNTPPSAPSNTNQDGPSPRLPLRFYGSPVGVTGAVFCDDCRIDGLDRKLLFGAVNNGNIRVLTLNGDRTGVSSDQLLIDHSSGVLSMESRPGQPVYFSTSTGIFRLVAA
jgi:glucose/arabinose dehydrogenase